MDIRVEPITVLGQAVKNLRIAIMHGEFRPGERLPEADLCDRMGISRASLREALRCLVTEKLIDVIPNRGYFVARLDERSVDDIREVWTVLTTEAVGKFAHRATAGDLKLMQGAIRGLARAVEAADVSLQLETIYEFFRVVFERGDNRVWSEMISALMSRIHVLRRLSIRPTKRQINVEQLQSILDALTRKDAADAMRLTRVHIDTACDLAKTVCRQGLDRAAFDDTSTKSIRKKPA
jgi:DNA-binding GntR family transcriptional regulator